MTSATRSRAGGAGDWRSCLSFFAASRSLAGTQLSPSAVTASGLAWTVAAIASIGSRVRADEGLSFKEVAAILHTTEETARWRVFKARQKLMKVLAPELLPPGAATGET